MTEKQYVVLKELEKGRKIGVRLSYTRFWLDKVRKPSLADHIIAPMFQRAELEQKDGFITISAWGRVALKFYEKNKINNKQ